nr:flagellar hook-length control protein FliK [Cytobacillus citreus]
MKSINEKLDILLNDSVRSNRDELLQKTFTNLVDELNGKSNVKSETNGDNVTKVLNKSEQVHQHGFIHFQQLSKPEQLTLFSQPANRPVSAEQLIEQFQSILSRSHFLKNGGTQRLFIKLNPEHLGALRVELIQKDSAIIARILTSTSTAKEMMESQLNGLKQAFHSQNIQVERVEISQQFTQQDRSFNREQQNGQERQEQHRQEQHEQQTNGEFTSSFEEALLNTEA